MKILVTALAAAAMLVACVGTASAASSSYCHQEAMAYADRQANAGAGALGGGVIGAVGGGLLGKAIGNGKRAVGAGAVVGGLAGATIGASQARKNHDRAYREAYDDCMSTPSRPVRYDAPPAGSREWSYACSQKYRSFDPESGTYQPRPDYAGGPLPPRRMCTLP